MGAVAKSYMRIEEGLPIIYEEMRKYLVIDEEAVSHTVHDFAIVPIWILLYMRKTLLSFLSVQSPSHRMVNEKFYNLYR
jgi:hypothetical protein